MFVITFVHFLWQVGCFHRIRPFSPPIKQFPKNSIIIIKYSVIPHAHNPLWWVVWIIWPSCCVCNRINMKGVTSGVETASHTGLLEIDRFLVEFLFVISTFKCTRYSVYSDLFCRVHILSMLFVYTRSEHLCIPVRNTCVYPRCLIEFILLYRLFCDVILIIVFVFLFFFFSSLCVSFVSY